MPSQKMSRRQALKVLLATTGGLTAAAFLPSKWLKPIVSAGVLPAHARASAIYFVDPIVSGVSATISIQAIAGTGITDTGVGHHLASPVDATSLCFPLTLQNILITMSYSLPAHGFKTGFSPTMPAPRLTGGTAPEVVTYTGGLTCPYTTAYYATFVKPTGYDFNDYNDTFNWIFTAPNGKYCTVPGSVAA